MIPYRYVYEYRKVDPTTYKDESDIFYEDPVAFMDNLLKNRSPTTKPKESHLVFFEDLINTRPDMRVWLASQGYHEVRYALPSFTFSQIAGYIYIYMNLYFLCELEVRETGTCVHLRLI